MKNKWIKWCIIYVPDIINAARGPIKCRIPQRLPSARTKPPAPKPKVAFNSKSVVRIISQLCTAVESHNT